MRQKITMDRLTAGTVTLYKKDGIFAMLVRATFKIIIFLIVIFVAIQISKTFENKGSYPDGYYNDY